MPKFLLDRSRSRWTRVGIPWQRAQGTSRHNATTTKVDRTQPQHNSHLQVSLICVENLKKTTELVPTTICGTCRRQKPMGFIWCPVFETNVQWSSVMYQLIYQLQGSCNGQVSLVVDPATKKPMLSTKREKARKLHGQNLEKSQAIFIRIKLHLSTHPPLFPRCSRPIFQTTSAWK